MKKIYFLFAFIFLSANLYPQQDVSTERWSFQDASAVGGSMMVSKDGRFTSVGWDLNNKRVCLYGNQNNSPLWTYTAPSSTNNAYTAISDTGGVIASSTYNVINLFNQNSAVPVFSYDVSAFPGGGTAGPIGLTGNGNYFVSCVNRSDTSTILGFKKDSSNYIWSMKVLKTVQGINISKNDSLLIVNTYNNFYVLNIFDGSKRYSDTILYGTQMKYGISGNGRIIAALDYRGYLKVFEWNGTTYILKWSFQEAPGTYYNWMTAVDISYDGNYIAAGTVIFVSSGVYDGRIRCFSTQGGNTPLWVVNNCGDQVTSVAFSRNARILTASCYGDLAHTKPDLYIFKNLHSSNFLMYSLKTNGSFYNSSISGDGTTAAADGKAVHARVMGSGGLLYNISVDTSENPSGIGPVTSNSPANFKLYQNYPNPFNPVTNIKFDVVKPGNISIKIFNTLGKEVYELVNGFYQPGTYTRGFDATGLASGIYIARFTAGDFSQTIKLNLLK